MLVLGNVLLHNLDRPGTVILLPLLPKGWQADMSCHAECYLCNVGLSDANN